LRYVLLLKSLSEKVDIMPCHGRIENGKVAPDDPFPWPDGTRVVVDVAEPEGKRSLADVLRPVIGKAFDLPPDMAENHDHYIHGTPKK
jgi:hypothetical protein